MNGKQPLEMIMTEWLLLYDHYTVPFIESSYRPTIKLTNNIDKSAYSGCLFLVVDILIVE